mgnify:CR=1 FL=1
MYWKISGPQVMLPGKNGKLIRLSKSCLSSLEKKSVLGVLKKEYADVMDFSKVSKIIKEVLGE